MTLSGKTVIITGASSGIGEATARAIVAKGGRVMLAARREDRLKALVASLGASATYRVTNVTDHASMLALGEATINALGHIDAIVNNAGIMPLSPLKNRRVDEWNQMIDVNIKGVLYGIDAVLTHMLAREQGHVINVSSVAGIVTNPTSAVYSATKHAVKAISEGLRKETAGIIRVTTIYPGAVTTELGASIKDPEVLAGLGKRFSFPFLAADDIASAVVFALESPAHMAVNDLVVRPIGQEL